MFGTGATQHFYTLGPDTILNSVEKFGFRTTGRVLTLNSMENRVYEVEIEVDEKSLKSASDKFKIIKFYRPGRWTKEQILEEHEFLFDLEEAEIPVISPLKCEGVSVFEDESLGIYFSVFKKQGGRMLDELNEESAAYFGRTLARLHQVGKIKKANHRLKITPENYGIKNLDFILENKLMPHYLEHKYADVVKAIVKKSTPLFNENLYQRIHGDCHRGNILYGTQGLFLVDFDDMVMGPTVQDLWLMIPGIDDEAKKQRDWILDAYETLNHFDYSTLKLIEPLRALRMIHFSAWIGKRYSDPAFKRHFPQYETEHYWNEQIMDLTDQLNSF